MRQTEMIKVPKGERGWTCYYDKSGECIFLLTSKEKNRDFYYLYEVSGGSLKKLGKARTPPELERQFKVDEFIKR